MELLLISLGSCTGSDVASILQKKRVPVDTMEVIVNGEREETHPKVYTKIHIEYIFYGTNMDTKDLERAIDLSQNKYCPISAMLGKACEITHSFEIKEKK